MIIFNIVIYYFHPKFLSLLSSLLMTIVISFIIIMINIIISFSIYQLLFSLNGSIIHWF